MPLSFHPVPPPSTPLPSGVTRSFISTPSGPLELLTSIPSHPNPTYPPLLFQHGGFGCASVYLDFLSYFSRLGYTTYALSIRGHGHSWNPSYFRFTFLTTAYTLATDIAAGITYISKLHNGVSPILIGHSNGAGLCQIVLDRGLAKTKGLVILAGVPNYGGLGVYWNWWTTDLWFMPRLYLRDFWHPKSPLSSAPLVKRMFFCEQYPMEKVEIFEKYLSWTEAFMWPMMMMHRFVSARKVLLAANGRVGCLCGEFDVLMTPKLMQRCRDEYAKERRKLVKEKKLEFTKVGAWYGIVKGSGHQVMNDLQWEDAARQLENAFKWIMEAQ